MEDHLLDLKNRIVQTRTAVEEQEKVLDELRSEYHGALADYIAYLELQQGQTGSKITPTDKILSHEQSSPYRDAAVDTSPIKIHNTLARTTRTAMADISNFPPHRTAHDPRKRKRVDIGADKSAPEIEIPRLPLVANSPNRVIPSSQLSEVTNDELSSSPLQTSYIKGDPDGLPKPAFETQQGCVADSIDLTDDGMPLLQEHQVDLDEEAETQIQVPSSPTPGKKVRRLSFATGNFDQEIDEDLKTGRRETTFPRPPNFQLPTPQTGGTAVQEHSTIKGNHTIDSWLKKNAGLRDQTSDTPTRARKMPNGNNRTSAAKTSIVSEADIIPKFESYESFYSFAIGSKWQRSDFIVNPEANDNIAYAFKHSLRGKNRQCVHGTSCKDCDKFYELAGTIEGTVKLSTTANVAQQKGSRHRDRWSRAESPPGFWRADFPDSQQEREDAIALEKQKERQVQERLKEALTPKGAFMFKDQRYRNELRRVVDK